MYIWQKTSRTQLVIVLQQLGSLQAVRVKLAAEESALPQGNNQEENFKAATKT